MGSKLDRKEAKIFASNCDNTLVTQFRTESADGSTASYSRDPDVIQNSNYEQGWVEDTNNLNTKIYGEDMNAVGYVQSYLLKYLYENGIPEWSPTTEYFEHSIARIDNRLFISLTDNNINNNPTNTVGEWAEIPLSAINITTSGTGSSIFSSSTGNDITLKSLSVDGYASLQDNGDQINIHVLGGSGVVDAFWGQIQGTLTNQADLVSALGDKQDNLTFDSPLSVDVNNEVSIPKATDSISGYLDSEDFTTFAGKQDALNGFTHSYDSDNDTASITPTATNSNIGTSQSPITNVNASNVNVNKIQGNTTATQVKFDANLIPDDDNTYDIGNTTSAVKSLFVNKLELTSASEGGGNSLETPRLKVTNGVSGIGIGYGGASPLTTGYTLGYNEAFYSIDVTTTNTDKIQGETTATTVQTGASIVPDADNTYNLGSSSNKSFANVYTRKVGSPGGVNNLISFGTTNGGDVTYDCGASGSGNYGSHVLKVGAGDKLTVGGSSVTSTVDILPGSDNTISLGGTNKFKNLSVNNIMNGGGNSVNITGATHKYLNGNTVHIYPATRTDGFTIGNTGGTGSEYTGRLLLQSNRGRLWIGNNTYNSIVYPGIHIDGNTFPTSNNAFYFGMADSKWKVIYGADLYGTTHGGSCDRDKKENIVERNAKKDKKSSLNTINSLETYTFNYKEDEEKKLHIGIMAQDLREFEPDLILNGASKESKEESLYVDIMGYCTLLTEAVQELSAKVESLEARIKILEGNDKVEEK